MNIQHLTYRFPVRVRRNQHACLEAALEEERLMYNKALEILRAHHDETGEVLGRKELFPRLTRIRKDDPERREHAQRLQRGAFDRARVAFENAVNRNRKTGKVGYPRFKGANRARTFGVIDREGWSIKGNRLRCKGVKPVEFREIRELPPDVRSWTMTRRDGRWTLAVVVAVECSDTPAEGPPVGIDMGVIDQIATSDGARIKAPCEKKIDAEIAEAQRKWDRIVEKDGKGKPKKASMKTARARKERRRINRLIKKRANRRRDHAHKVAKKLALNHELIVLEKLLIANMTRSAKGTKENPGTNAAAKRGLNKSMLRASLSRLKALLEYKCRLHGSRLVEVDPKNTSRECHECGHVAKENRRRKKFRCLSCGHEDDADVNAARNILRKGRGSPEDTGLRSGGSETAAPPTLGQHCK